MYNPVMIYCDTGVCLKGKVAILSGEGRKEKRLENWSHILSLYNFGE